MSGYFLLRIFLFAQLALSQLVLAQIDVRTNGKFQQVIANGEDGKVGRDGESAFQIDCSENPRGVVDGIAGSDGEAGEDGEHGRDIRVYYTQLTELNLLLLENRGGYGAAGGAGGRGSSGCRGGEIGADGRDGNHGVDGGFGKVFLVGEGEVIPDSRSTMITDLGTLSQNRLQLSYLAWKMHKGLRDLLDPRSVVADVFYTFEAKITKKISLNWQAEMSMHNLSDTKLAISYTQQGFKLNVYRGAFLSYSINENETTVEITVTDAIREDSLANLSLGRLRKFGTGLLLELNRRYRIDYNFKTEFAITLASIDSGSRSEQTLGHFKIPPQLVRYVGDKFEINIGKLNFPAQYKKKGEKLVIFLSVYRQAQTQRRAYVLDGVFKI